MSTETKVPVQMCKNTVLYTDVDFQHSVINEVRRLDIPGGYCNVYSARSTSLSKCPEASHDAEHVGRCLTGTG